MTVLETLQIATRNVWAVSESDTQVEAFEWDQVLIDTTQGEAIPMAAFLESVKLNELTPVLNRLLIKPLAYKYGSVVKDVYVLGKTDSGTWAGIKTQVVET